jgi:hypothetical protein
LFKGIAITIENPDPDSHSELPPSSSDKWLNCYAWLNENRGLRQSSSSAAAEEGTKAHLALSDHLQGIRPIEDCDDPEMYDLIRELIDYIAGMEGDLYSEIRVDFGDQFGFVGLTGTADVIVVTDECITVLDLKYGKVSVEVEDNTQLMIYLSGAVAMFGERKEYRLIIAQPRSGHFKGPIREEVLSHDKLRVFNLDLEIAIVKNYRSNAPHRVGDHCRKWCNALATCKAVKDYSLKALRETPHD